MGYELRPIDGVARVEAIVARETECSKAEPRAATHGKVAATDAIEPVPELRPHHST